MTFDALTGVLLVPAVAAALLAALPDYRLTARLNVLATTLTFVIVAAAIGQETGKLTSSAGAALVAAGLLSAALFPASADRLLARGRKAASARSRSPCDWTYDAMPSPPDSSSPSMISFTLTGTFVPVLR